MQKMNEVLRSLGTCAQLGIAAAVVAFAFYHFWHQILVGMVVFYFAAILIGFVLHFAYPMRRHCRR